MKILSYGRGLGKTYEAVKYAKENNCMVVVSSEKEKKKIKEMYEFEDVYTLIDIQDRSHIGKQYDGAVFDNIDLVLFSLTGLIPRLLTVGAVELRTKKVFAESSLENISPTSLDYYSG